MHVGKLAYLFQALKFRRDNTKLELKTVRGSSVMSGVNCSAPRGILCHNINKSNSLENTPHVENWQDDGGLKEVKKCVWVIKSDMKHVLWVTVTTIFRRFHSQKKPTESHRNMHRSSVENLMWNQLFLTSTIPQNSPWNPGGGAAWSCSTVLVVQLIKHHLSCRVSGSLWLQKYKTLTGHYSFRWVMYLYINTIVVKGQKLVSIYDNNNYLKISLQHDLTRD